MKGCFHHGYKSSCLLTGPSGIGYEMGKAFAKEGAKVVITDRLEERAKEALNNYKMKVFKLSV